MSHRPASLVLVALLALVGCGRESESDCDAASTAVERVEVRPGTVTLAEGDTTRLQAIAYSCAGRLEGAGPFAWRSSATSVATVDDAGLVTAVGDGSVRIYAALQGKEAYAVVQSGAVPVAAVQVIPVTATVGLNRSGPLTAIALDGQGRELTGRITTWSSNNEGGVSVTPNGTVAGMLVGARATITARIENQSSTSTITVSSVVVSAIEITGRVASLPVGASFPFDARTADAQGDRLEGRIIAWSSSDPSVARVSPTGVVTGLRSGAVTITARSEGLSATAPLAVSVGAPARLGFVVQPTTATAGAPITPAVQVEVLDDLGNRVTASQASVTLALAANPGGATLAGTLTRTAVQGVATFEGLQLDRTGTGYRLAASAANLAGATSAAFDVTSSAVASLVFVQQPPASAAGVAMSPAPQVEARDALGNRVTSFAQPITLAIDDNPGSGALGGTVTVGAVEGRATFTNVYVSRPGSGYTLLASSGSLAVTSAAFDVAPGPAGRLVFLTQPSTVVAGSAISPAVQVEVQDGLGNRVTSSTAPITIALGSNPGNATLGGTATVNAVGGVATFGTLSVSAAGTAYTLAASSAGLANATSATFNVTARPATQLAFTVQPSTAAAGTAISPPIQVEVRNAIGERVTGSTASVTLALGANPGGSTLGGTVTVNAIDGVATFGAVTLNRPATGYTLTASAAGLTGATSTTFDITAGAPGRLVFLTQPTTSAAGAAITPAVQVEIQDALGNRVTGSSAAVTVSLANNPGNSALQGTTVVNASAGVATFGNLSLTAVGTGYTLAATSASVAGATSSAFNVTPGTPTRLTVLAQPSNVVAGAAISPAVQIEIEDAFGNRATQFNGSVSVALGANPGGATLSGTTSVAASGGVATFSNVRLDRTGLGYTLAASSAGLTGVTTTSFNVTPAAATALRYVVQPASASAGATISPPVQVEVIDAFGNRVGTSGTSVSVAFGTNPTGATLNGTTTASTTSGLATFATLSVSAAGSGYTLAASSAGLTGATSNAFTITAGAAAQLVILQQPSNVMAGAAISPAITVEVRDALGNRVTTSSAPVTLAIGTNPGGAVVSGTPTVNAVNGVATFGNVRLDKVGNGYTLTASSSGLTGTTSSAFSVTAAPASALRFVTQPANLAAGGTITPAVQVEVIDAFGNRVTTATNIVGLAFGTNPTGATLGGTTSVAASAGVATFSTLTVTTPGTGYTLAASAAGLTGATSTAFNVTAGNATQLAFIVQPSDAAAGAAISPAIQVEVRDALGNRVTTSSASITLAIGTNPGGATASGTLTVAAASGVATFGNVRLDKAGTGYTLTAASGALSGATSGTFTVTPGTASALAFTVQPSDVAAGAAITPAIQVEVRDAQGNRVTSSSASITLAIGTNPGGATASGTLTASASSGVATFGNVRLDKVGTGYTLTAASGGLTGATSAGFAVTPGPATTLLFLTQPGATTAGVAISPAVQVEVRDAQGNRVTGSSAPVTIATASGPGAVGGTTSVNAVSGVATFSALTLTVAGDYTLGASATGLTGATSGSFTVTPATPTKLGFVTQPSNVPAGNAITPAVQVEILDQYDNRVTSSNATVSIAIGDNPGGSTLGGTADVAATAGLATFGDLTLDIAGTGYTLTASGTGLTGATSTAFDVQ